MEWAASLRPPPQRNMRRFTLSSSLTAGAQKCWVFKTVGFVVVLAALLSACRQGRKMRGRVLAGFWELWDGPLEVMSSLLVFK